MSQTKTKGKRTTSRRRSPWPIVVMTGGLLLVVAVIAVSILSRTPTDTEDTGPGSPAISISSLESSPDAQIDGLNVNFGDMKLGGELATLTLTVANSGDKTLIFTKEPYIQLADGC